MRCVHLLLMVIGTAGTSAVAGGQTHSVVLRARYRQGEVHTYAIITQIAKAVTPDQAPISLAFKMKMHVLKVRGGLATIRLSASPPEVAAGALPSPFKVDQVVLDSSNRPVGKSHSGQIFSSFPSGPIVVGTRWKGVSHMSLPDGGDTSVSTSYRLNSVQNVKGREVAEIGMQLTGLAWGEGTELVDVADGSLLASDMNLHVDQKRKIPVQIVMKRQN